jgi:6-phosphogluconolactonase
MTTIERIVCEDCIKLAEHAAALIQQAASDNIRSHGRFTLVLAGGSTPEKTYSLLARPQDVAKIDWSRTHLFFGDERLVPPDDPRSNFGMAQRTLFARVPVPSTNIFPIPTSRGSAAECAALYADTLSRFFQTRPGSPPPSFDLLLLGMGDDGHTASLFPGHPALQVTDSWVTSSPPGVLPPPVDRITFTFPVLNAARHVVFLVAGDKKAAVLRDVLEGGATPQQHPAAGVRPTQGKLTWLLDRAAAALLRPSA